MYLLIDALDECSSDHRVHPRLCRDLPAKIFITSRREADIIDGFHSADVLKVNIQAADVADDIKLFVHNQVAKFRQRGNGKRLYLSEDSLVPIITSSLTEQSDGMFLWVDLQLDNICRVSRAHQDHLIREALSMLPRGLENTYLRIAHRIENDDPYMRNLAVNCLMWVLNAERPLREAEVQHALKLREKNPIKNLDPIDVILDACGNLLITEDDIIRPAHFSVKEFFIGSPFRGSLRSLQDLNLVHEKMALGCFQYLGSSLRNQSPYKDPFRVEEFLAAHPLVEYLFQEDRKFQASLLQLRAIRYPGRFTDLLSSTRLIIPEADASSVLFATRLVKASTIRNHFAHLKPQGYALHQSAGAGHVDLSERLLEEGFTIDERDLNCTTPLYHACLEDQVEVVSLLLKHGANVNAEGGYYGCALQAATSRGSLEIMKMLIDHGAAVDGHTGNFGSALIVAIKEGHLNLVKLLLDKGANVNLQGSSYYGSPLETAAAGGDKEIVQRLLCQPHVLVNVPGGHFGTALTAAAANGRGDLVKMLLDAGADVNVQAGYYGTALKAACAGGWPEIFRSLLNYGADPHSQGGHYGTCLQAASVCGHTVIVRMLLDHGVNVNAQGGNYDTALQGASASGRADIVQILLENGAAVDIKGGQYGTALQAASNGGHSAIVSVLLQNRSSVNTLYGYFGTALQAASYWGHEDIFQTLLDHGADPNLQGGYYGNALQAASARGYESMVKQLLQYGVDVQAQGGKYGTALDAASAKGHENVRRIILDFERNMAQC
ncbi:hypothetical protein N7519_008609 [Penicillium mononematosum]|uniref:uncharacterized protein n=1 Tax=Penicillium mononematosum TaxID=268346 RepID=UPI0025474B3A|nr:uncharacterized protein N7519_008609 [Penicillium mononematosum]KAJ6178148.1 hypothetical protein N7519_008609 [Penicillium mononematosum]